MPDLILVNAQDQAIGKMEKLATHQQGKLHRAISIFIFNSKGQFLIQQRDSSKYHCPGLWSNTACSHPYPGETTTQAANRRLKEEMGLKAQLEFKFKFHYQTEFSNGLIENEIDHVFVGTIDQDPVVNPEEVQDFKWIDLQTLQQEIQKHPLKYTFWFKLILSNPNYLQQLTK